MIGKNKIEDVPKNFLEARNIDTANFEIKLKDKEVETVSMNSKANFEQFKEFLINNNLENILNNINLKDIKEIHTFISENKNINSSNINEYNTFLSFAIDNKNIELLDSLYSLDNQSKNDSSLLELKFLSYAEALDITRDDVYAKMLEKYFNLDSEEIKNLENIEKTFDTYFELSNLKDDSNLIDEDIKYKLYIENLTESIIQKYDEFQWQHFDMDNENIPEKNMQLYFETTQKLTEEGNLLNEYVSNTLEIKSLENKIEESLLNGNFKETQELLQDERLDTNTRLTFQYMYESMLGNEHILDEVYENVIDKVELDEKVYETFKEDDFLNDMKKIDLEDELMDEIAEEMRQEEIEEHERILGGE
jgi:ribosomal protein S18